MAGKTFTSVDEYIAAFPEETRAVLRQLRSILRKALPDAEEVISYRMPAYRLGGRPVIWFAGWKSSYSIYPLTRRLSSALKTDLAPYKANKSTLRFPLSRPVPAQLIERIAKLRAEEDSEGRHASRGTKPARA